MMAFSFAAERTRGAIPLLEKPRLVTHPDAKVVGRTRKCPRRKAIFFCVLARQNRAHRPEAAGCPLS